ncbi:MAG: T9SS type A sorting domain-containing protein [Chitinophagaceae bacterium]|nr:T9SS type A sorting domain-containing protein [Chitinophagaceae bacterium]
MFRQTITVADLSIPVSQYPAGMYQLEVNENGNKITAKFIKQ